MTLIMQRQCFEHAHRYLSRSTVSLGRAHFVVRNAHSFPPWPRSSQLRPRVTTLPDESSTGANVPQITRAFNSCQTRHAHRSVKTVDYLLADVGEGITECEIVKWFVEPGTHVEEFDTLVEVQSDKASVEITSRYTGQVVEHCYSVGQVARVGSPLCRIEVHQDGKEAEQQQPQTPIASDQATDTGELGSDVSKNEEDDKEHSNEDKKSKTTGIRLPIPNDARERHRTLATPAVRRITRENGVDIAAVQGTGRDGRVTKEDVQSYLAHSESREKVVNDDKFASNVGALLASSSSSSKDIPLSGVRRAMFKGMTATWAAPHFGYSEEIDVTRLDLMRKQILADGTSLMEQDEATKGLQGKLTLLPFLLKGLSLALHRHPIFRSKLDERGMKLIQKDEHQLSIAFATPKGLLTPTLRGDVRDLSVADIAKQISVLQEKGAQRGLTQEELGTGATVTLSNIGSIGGTYTFPLLPPTGQLIIGAVGRTRTLPRFDEHGQIVKAQILPVSFSADHRVVEGVELARFVGDWKRILENPSGWIFSLR